MRDQALGEFIINRRSEYGKIHSKNLWLTFAYSGDLPDDFKVGLKLTAPQLLDFYLPYSMASLFLRVLLRFALPS